MTNYTLILPDDFDEYEWEVTSKGFFSDVRLVISETSYRLLFYDPVRLNQEIKDELRRQSFFFEANIVVVSSVTRINMERAAGDLVKSVYKASLIAE